MAATSVTVQCKPAKPSGCGRWYGPLRPARTGLALEEQNRTGPKVERLPRMVEAASRHPKVRLGCQQGLARARSRSCGGRTMQPQQSNFYEVLSNIQRTVVQQVAHNQPRLRSRFESCLYRSTRSQMLEDVFLGVVCLVVGRFGSSTVELQSLKLQAVGSTPTRAAAPDLDMGNPSQAFLL